MKRLFLLLLLPAACWSQTMADCKQRFEGYLNFRNTLSENVKFEGQAMHLVTGGRRTLSVFEDELVVMAKVFEYTPLKRQLQVLGWKGTTHLPKKTLDSLDASINDTKSVIEQGDSLPLRGYRVALDPGHFGTTLEDAKVEQKYLYFPRPAYRDTVLIFESRLTFETAVILKNLLEEQGAAVFLTRTQANHTSFGCTYQEFLKNHRKRVLDSLLIAKQLTPAKHRFLLKANDYDFFWKFFRDYDLANRVAKINRFDPHAAAIIHYNVDEKNVPWQKNTGKDFTMAFIGGAMTSRDITTPETRAHLVRLLVTNQLDRSEKLAAGTVAAFANNLKVPVAKPRDATYLYQKCKATGSPGVFSRNLVLCRAINAPLVYGESLYQDNEKECNDLMRCNVEIYGLLTSERVTKVAASYYEALFGFLRN